MPDVRILTDAITLAGESPVWDVAQERLYWIDNSQGLIFRGTPDGREISVWQFPRLVTAIAVTADERLLVASGRRVFRFDLDSGETEGVFRSTAEPAAAFNDGKVDRQGRFVTGSVDSSVFAPNAPEAGGQYEPNGRLHVLDSAFDVTVVPGGIGITNGPCFSPDGAILYCGDSWARCIYMYDYDASTGTAAHPRIFTTFESDAMPDGATIDDEGCLWVANFRGGEIRRYGPDGNLDRSVRMPVAHPTSVMFGGSNLDVLFVTTHGNAGVPGQDSASTTGSPLAGRLFAVHGLGVRGIPERRFGA